MQDATFSNSLRKLSWKNRSWDAVSGPWGKGVLPNGVYTIERRKLTEYTTNIGNGFKDETGKGYFIPLTPTFDIGGRTGFGIHPDGNKPGTKGCVGIRKNAYSFYSAIAVTSPSSKILLKVVD